MYLCLCKARVSFGVMSLICVAIVVISTLIVYDNYVYNRVFSTEGDFIFGYFTIGYGDQFWAAQVMNLLLCTLAMVLQRLIFGRKR